jgi:hypothetical protein
MSPAATTAARAAGLAGPANPWLGRVEATDWATVQAGLDETGCALTGPLLSTTDASEIAALYDDNARFRSTVNMGRHRFGEGEYRYFAEPFPTAVDELKRALFPKLLPIARNWWTKLGRETRWPDDLDDWLQMCHAAGQDQTNPDSAEVHRR